MKIHHSASHGQSIAKEESECENCKTTFTYYPSCKPGKYCSDCVDSGKYIDTSGLDANRGLSGEDNPNYGGGEYRGCDWCNNQTYASPSDIKKKDNIFCCEDCYNEWKSENYQGEGNPFWKGGYNPNYSDGWWSMRRKTLERDNFNCQICGAQESPSGRNCDVHHKKPVRKFDNPSDAHFMENLVTLCRPCHIDVENGDRKI